MTQDRRGSARDVEDLPLDNFGLGLDEAPDPSDAFAVPPARQPAPARAQSSARPEPDDLPDLEDDPFGGPPSFEPAPPAAPSARHQPDPGDWDSMQEIGGSAPRGGGFGGGDEPDGDPDEEFRAFGGARSVAALGRHPDEPEPKGSYRADEGDPNDDVVTTFADEDDQNVIPKGTLYREDQDDEAVDAEDGDPSLSMDDETDAEAGSDDDEEETGKTSLVDRLKRLAIPAAAAAAIGGAGYVGWGFVSPMLLGTGEVAPIQTAAPIVPKQPLGGLPAFPPPAQAQQRPPLPGSAATLPALPGQQPVSVSQQTAQPRQVGLPPAPPAGLPQAPAAQLPSIEQPARSYPAVSSPQQPIQQVAAAQPVLPGPAQVDPLRPTAPAVPSLGGGLNARTAPQSDIEAKLAAIASDVAALRSHQEDAARTARSDRDEIRGRLGEVERRLEEAGRPQASQKDREEAKPRRAERVEREVPAERPARLVRRVETRPASREAVADDGMPPLKPKVVQGFALKGVSRGIASVEGRTGVVEVGVGQSIPGVGEVKAIRRYGSDWVVVVGKGVIVQQ